jgi:hypothetical protein
MACRGVHFALSRDDEHELLARAEDDDHLIDFIQEEIEEAWDREWLCETDKAWDAIHRCLTDGKLDLDNGRPPLNQVILGGRQLYGGDDYFACYVDAATVPQVAAALRTFTREQFDTAYDSLKHTDYSGPHNTDDREYTWAALDDLKGLWAKAASAGRSVIFTVDQ